MPITKVNIEDFLQLSKMHLLIDVRSPSEYTHAHIPNAISLPLFTDDERKIIGTAYKQESKQQAVKHGLKYFGVNMVQMVETVEELIIKHQKKNRARFSKYSSNSLLAWWYA